MNLFELGQALKLARIQQALTQRELAMRTGISLSTISGLERGTISEIGSIKLLQLFSAVGLELRPLPSGQRRTLDDIQAEIQAENTQRIQSDNIQTRQRVRHTKMKGKNASTT